MRWRKDEEWQLEEEERGKERGRGRGSGRGRERGMGRERGIVRGRGRGRGKEREISNKDKKIKVGGGVEEVAKGEEERRSLEDMEVEVERVREKECERTKQIQG